MDEFSGDGGEFGRFIEVWFTVFSSLIYCYYIVRNIPKGFPRLLFVLPIVYIFILLPLNLTSIHLVWGAGFFISWIANFKLVLFCFDMGPLSSNTLPVLQSSTTLVRFLVIACLPIKIRQSNSSSSSSSIELSLVIYASITRLLLNLEVEPPFGNLLVLSPSFHEFWGRRWNKVVSSLLRSLVYEPVRRITKQSWGIYVAILATFSVSGLMHELMIFYPGRKKPWGGLLVFFILQGVGVSVEIYLKRSWKWQLNQLVSQLILQASIISSSFT
ncbi:hypothetical protein MKW92_032656 [Papaver armeniacum]|nr:hypothetical protein MKW92_032656 [Papaver armeniacum]